jgi:hypothetical protein
MRSGGGAHSTVPEPSLVLRPSALGKKEASYMADTNWRWGHQLTTWIKCNEVVLRQKIHPLEGR